MKREERQRAILEFLNPIEPVQNKTLIEHFHVTDMTIRRDLNALAAQGKLIRTHGGAILLASDRESDAGSASSPQASGERQNLEPAYKARAREHSPQKAAIARACIVMMAGKKYVYLDSGSTTYSIARLVTPDLQCIILTNGINIAAQLLRQDYPSVVTIGGEVHLNTWATRGAFAENQVRAFHSDITFLGCNAISPEGSVMIGNMAESGLKQAIMDISNEIYLVADSNKFDSYSLTTYASVRDFSGIITDSQLPGETRDKLESFGAKIIIGK